MSIPNASTTTGPSAANSSPNGNPSLTAAGLLQLNNQSSRLTSFLGTILVTGGAPTWQLLWYVGTGQANEINEILLTMQGTGTCSALIQIVPSRNNVTPPTNDLLSQLYFPSIDPGTTIVQLQTAVPRNAGVYIKVTLGEGQSLAVYFSGLGASS